MVQWRPQHRIEIFLPLRRGDGRPVDKAEFDAIERELADRHGGATAYLQSPAEGLWAQDGRREEDRIVVIEVMTDRLETDEWARLKADLERRFQQQEIVLRAVAIQRLTTGGGGHGA
jgi:hypothetical protein